MIFKLVFDKVNFVRRYKKICKDHSDSENKMSGNERANLKVF